MRIDASTPGLLSRLRETALARPFDSESLERAFLADCAKRFAGQRRAMIGLGAVTWVAFVYWDIQTLEMVGSRSETFRLVVGIRIAAFFCIVGLLAAAMGAWFERSERAASNLCAVTSFLVFLAAYWQMRLMPSEAAHTYYSPALLIVVSYILAAFRASGSTVTVLLMACICSPLILINIEAHVASKDLGAETYFVWRYTNFLFAAGLLSASIGHQLERSQRLTFLREHELALSNEAFRHQSEELRSLNEEIRQSSRQSEEKAAALVDLKEKLRASAERKNREKSQFLASAVHDLRQPLQAVSNALEPARLCVARGDVPAAAEMLELAQRASTLMAEQLAAMLEMSRLESGFVSAEIEIVDLVAIVETSVAQLTEGASKESVKLRIETFSAHAWVLSDRHFLGRILRNLVGNGIKYGDPAKHPDREVCIRVINLPACVRLEVEDNGLGIDAPHLADGSIFKPFHQLGNGLAQADKGVGLGLSIVSALLGLMPEHHLDVDSTPGKGTRMIVTLPHGPARFVHAVANAQAAAVASMVQLAGVYVVIVEDDEMVGASMALLLSAHGAIHETVTSFEALEELLPALERRPDLVLSDFRLPNRHTALDVCRAARLYDDQLPVLVLTGEALSPTMQASLAPAQVIYKPVPAVELVRAIDALVARTSRVAVES